MYHHNSNIHFRPFMNIRPNGTSFGEGLWIRHVNGDLNRVEPMDDFQGFPRGVTKESPFMVERWNVARTDVMPNWYVTSSGVEPRVVKVTEGEELKFVTDYTTPEQWKREEADQYNPLTPEVFI